MTDRDLDGGARQMSRQRELARGEVGEAHENPRSGEPRSAIKDAAHPRWNELMEEVAAHENLARAMKRVRKNRGSPGIDGMTVDELAGYLERNENVLQEQLLAGTYEPQPVRRVMIPKPDGGERELGIPTVVDRLVQQAILAQYLKGWKQYFGICEVPTPRRDLDEWIRARLRLLQVKQWKRGRTAYSRLVAMGAPERAAVHTAQHLRRWWYAAHSPGANLAMPKAFFTRLGLPQLVT